MLRPVYGFKFGTNIMKVILYYPKGLIQTRYAKEGFFVTP